MLSIFFTLLRSERAKAACRLLMKLAPGCRDQIHTLPSPLKNCCINHTECFKDFRQAKFPNGGSVSDSSQFSILLQLPPKIILNSKVVKIDPKIIISLHKSKYVTHSVQVCLPKRAEN